MNDDLRRSNPNVARKIRNRILLLAAFVLVVWLAIGSGLWAEIWSRFDRFWLS